MIEEEIKIRKDKNMNLESLKNIKPTRTTHGRPSTTLTDKEWQNELSVMKLYITPHNKTVTRIGGKYSRGQELRTENNEYYGITNWQSYCAFINDVLKNIRSGNRDFCYYGYQIIELLKFHYEDLRTRYCDGYWEVWLERN